MMREFALYRGDKFITFGTEEQLAKLLGVKKTSIKFYRSPSWLKRTNYQSWVLVDVTEEKEPIFI